MPIIEDSHFFDYFAAFAFVVFFGIAMLIFFFRQELPLSPLARCQGCRHQPDAAFIFLWACAIDVFAADFSISIISIVTDFISFARCHDFF